jgi:hypothetical protein
MNMLRCVAGMLLAFAQWFFAGLLLYPGLFVISFNDGPPRPLPTLLPIVLIFIAPAWLLLWFIGFWMERAIDPGETKLSISAGWIIGGVALIVYGLWCISSFIRQLDTEEILIHGSLWVIPGIIITIQGFFTHDRAIGEISTSDYG